MTEKDPSDHIKYTEVPVYKRKRQALPPLQLSPSSISSFNQCRQRYKFLYIDKLGDIYGKPKPYFTMANHIHATMKDFFRLQPLRLRTADNLEKIYQRNWQRYRVGFRNAEDELRWQAKGLAQLKTFFTRHDVNTCPLMMEEFLEVKITPGLILRGRLDRVDKEKDGSLHIIDYKTGNVPATPEWSQLELHALLLSRYAHQTVSRVSYLYLQTSVLESDGISLERLEHVNWQLMSTAKDIRREKKFLPAPGPWCRQCDFLPICPDEAKVQESNAGEYQLELWDDINDD